MALGKRFSLWFVLLDQFGRKFSDPKQQYLFSASLNANNPQGAVLWGARTNYTSLSSDGVLELNSLVISQSGEVDFKISVTATSASGLSSSTGRGGAKTGPQLVEVFRLQVAEDPIVSSAAPCIYLLQRTVCPLGGNTAAEWESEFPRTRSYSPGDSLAYLRNIYCAGDAMSGWHVNAFLSADASLWTEYRMGVDSIWTGVGKNMLTLLSSSLSSSCFLNDNIWQCALIKFKFEMAGMPKLEMSPMERLGLFASADGVKSLDGAEKGAAEKGKSKQQQSSGGGGGGNSRNEKGGKRRERALQKEIRRAYYRRSLQWHPDRWAGLSMYTLPVQAAFELINEAYNALISADADDAESVPVETATAAPSAEEAVFE